MTASAQVRSVRALYKRILTLHKKLPIEMKAIGDEYAKAEFRRHKNVGPKEAASFVREWTNYADMIELQTSEDKPSSQIGTSLTHGSLEDFREEQLGQLLELHKETSKPSTFPQEEKT